MPAKIVFQVVRGFLMGSADVVPGVSGGTVAFLLGIYPALIEAIASGGRALAAILRLDLREASRLLRGVDWGFLLPLLAGIALAIITLARVIERLLEDEPVRLAGMFFGLVLGSIVVVLRRYGAPDKARILLLVFVGAVTFALLGLRGAPVAEPALGLVLVAGAIAICAMILPGISGAFLLVMMGMYNAMIHAVNERELIVIAVFMAGAVIGLGLFSNLLRWMLSKHQATVLAVLIGVMAGSLRVLWPWPEGTAGTRLAAPSGDVFIPAMLAVAGAALAGVLALIAGRKSSNLLPPDGGT